jgi:hypothetical protein
MLEGTSREGLYALVVEVGSGSCRSALVVEVAGRSALVVEVAADVSQVEASSEYAAEHFLLYVAIIFLLYSVRFLFGCLWPPKHFAARIEDGSIQ